MKIMWPPGYHHNGFVATRALEHVMCNCTSCAQVHELPQSRCGDNGEGTFISWLHICYAHLASVRFEHSVSRRSHSRGCWVISKCQKCFLRYSISYQNILKNGNETQYTNHQMNTVCKIKIIQRSRNIYISRLRAWYNSVSL